MIGRLYTRLGRARAKQLFEQIFNSSETGQQIGKSTSSILALVLAGLVHLLSLSVGLAGVAMIIYGWPHFMFLLIGALLIAFFWLLRPRVGKLPEDRLDPSAYPAIHEMVGQLSKAMGQKPVSAIVIDSEFNASFGQVGLKRDHVLWIGLPLWSVLDDDERVSVICHELAHGANGDPARSWFTGTAIDTLEEWCSFLRQDNVGEISDDERLAQVIMRAVAVFIEAYGYVLALFTWQDSQKAEYYADRLAAQTAGSKSMIGCLHKLSYSTYLDKFLNRSMFTPNQKGAPVIDGFEKFVRGVPESELERLRRCNLLEGSRLDNTHPPTAYRVAMIEHGDQFEAAFVIDPDLSEKVTREMAHFRDEAGDYYVAMMTAHQ